MFERKVELPGSERRVAPGARDVGDVDASKQITVSVYLRPNPAGNNLPAIEDLARLPPAQRHSPTEAEIADARWATEEDVATVCEFAKSASLAVVDRSRSKRRVQLKGTVAALSKAFDVKLRRFEHRSGAYRGRTGAVHIPTELVGIVRAVLGLDNRRIGRSYRRMASHTAFAARTGMRPFLPNELAKIYGFPPTTGAGQCIAVLAFNGQIGDTGSSVPGGYRGEGLTAYFSKVTRTTPPTIEDIVVHGPGNSPGDGADPNDSTGEILLDLEMVGAIAPHARIVVYFTEFTEQGWVDAIHEVIDDKTNKPSVLSISYGNAETSSDSANVDERGSLWTFGAITEANEAFHDAALKNITICVASGDDGSADGVSDGLAHTDFPASSPYVLACGGTRLLVSHAGTPSEQVWNDGRTGGSTGGGISDLFPLPSWQHGIGVPASANPGHRIGRGVPDVASVADPATGVLISGIDGTVDPSRPTGGTSAAAPLWAALLARLNQALGAPVGFFNPFLYAHCAHGILRDITRGDNGAYQAAVGWDACTGVGTPDGARLATALGASPAAVMQSGPAEHVANDGHMAEIERRLQSLEQALSSGLSPTRGSSEGRGNGPVRGSGSPA
jgi:kumamolisin